MIDIPLIFVSLQGISFGGTATKIKQFRIPMPLIFSKKPNEFFRIPFSSEIPFSHDHPLSSVPDQCRPSEWTKLRHNK
jgi:hypothetical protein